MDYNDSDYGETSDSDFSLSDCDETESQEAYRKSCHSQNYIVNVTALLSLLQ
jgi:hypothetical protein